MLNELKKQDIILLYKVGRTLRQISDTTGAGQATIMRVLKEKNIKLRGEHNIRINRAKLKQLPTDYLEGKFTIKQLLKKYSVKSEQTLYRILDELQLPRKRLIIKSEKEEKYRPKKKIISAKK